MSSQHVLNDIKKAIAERNDVTAAELDDELLASEQPLVLRSLVSNWPAVEKSKASADAAIEYLQAFDSGHAVTALYAPAEARGRIFYNEDTTAFNFEYQRMALADAVSKVRSHLDESSSPSLYIGSTNIDHWLPGFRDENDLRFDTWSLSPASG